MSNILVLTDRIPPEHSATGRLIYHIARELGKTQTVFLVCLCDAVSDAGETSLHICPVVSRYGKYRALTKKAAAARGVQKLFYKIWYHLYYRYAKKKGLSDVFSHRKALMRQCCRLMRAHNVGTIISSSNPFENQMIAHAVWKKHPSAKWYPYMMDSSRNNAVRAVPETVEKQLFSHAEKIVIVPAILFDQNFCGDYADKICVLDLPIVPVQTHDVHRDDGKVRLIYAGLFYPEIRSPEHLFRLLEKLPENYELEVYGGGCQDIVKIYRQELGERLRVNGFVSPAVLNEKTAESDILVNIGNTILNQVSSKVYDLVACGKPILNFYQNAQDISLEHVKEYPLLGVFEYRTAEDNANAIVSFCETNKGKALSYEEATGSMQDKRLSAVAQRLSKILNLEEEQ